MQLFRYVPQEHLAILDLPFSKKCVRTPQTRLGFKLNNQSCRHDLEVNGGKGRIVDPIKNKACLPKTV